MDVTLSEPAVTARLRAILEAAHTRLSEQQRRWVGEWNRPIALDAAVLLRLRESVDAGLLARSAKRLAYRAQRIAQPVMHAENIGSLMQHAAERPAAVSAVLWRWIGLNNDLLASHLIQIVRERAGLPSLRRVITPAEMPAVAELQLTWFADRQLEDAARWMENVPPPTTGTLVEISDTLARERERAPRISIGSIVPFVKRAASLFLHLSTRGLDPLGFVVGSDAQLDIEPTMEQRLELTRWARGAGRAICTRGAMMTLTIPIQASAPHALQLIGAELGTGVCGGLMFLLRLLGPVSMPSLSPAPPLLCLPDDSLDERGARFERWLSSAYPHATSAWRAWS